MEDTTTNPDIQVVSPATFRLSEHCPHPSNTYSAAILVNKVSDPTDKFTPLMFAGTYTSYADAGVNAERLLHVIRHFGIKFGLRTGVEMVRANILIDMGNSTFVPVNVNPIYSHRNCEDLEAHTGDIELVLYSLRTLNQ